MMADPQTPETPAAPLVPAPAPPSGLEASAEVSIPGLPESPGPAAEGALAFFNPDAIPYALVLVIGTAIAVRVVQNLANRVAESAVGYRLVIKQGVTLLGFLAYGVAGVLAVLALFELSAQAIFALSGTLAVAGGFLLKDVAEATVAGISILVSRPFQVGDRISFGGFYGEVQDIGLRSVRLVTLDDNLVTIPSSKFLSEPVASANSGALDCMVVMPFFISAEADHVRARQIVIDAVRASRYLYLGKPVTVMVGMKLAENLGTVVELTAKAYVYDARHEKSFSSDVTDRVLRAFRGAGILFPSEVGAA